MLKRSRVLVLLVLLSTMIFVSACSTGTTQTGGKTEVDPVVTAVNEYFASMPEDIYKIDQVAFVDKVKAGEAMTIIDIRSADAYAQGHIKGALSMPWGPNLAENLTKIPADKPVMIYCVTGQTAGQTVALLNIAGFDTKSVNLGWNLGISKVEGVDAVIETTPNAFDDAVKTEIDRLEQALAMIKFKQWYYEQALRDGHEERLATVIPQDLPAEIKSYYALSHPE